MKAYFQKTFDACSALLTRHDKTIEDYQKTVEYFGESSTNDIAGFFANWNKFISSFRAAVKFNVALRKKQEIEKKKEKEAKLKKKEEENVKKFTDTLRASRKCLPQEMLKQGQKLDEQALEGENASASSSASSRRRKVRKKAPTKDIVNEIIDNNMEFIDGPSAGLCDDNGVVQQISKGIRTGDTFSRLRGKRMAAAKKTDASSSGSSSNAAPASAETSSSAKRQLRSQKSTFSRSRGSRAAKQQPSSSTKGSSGKNSLAGIQWG